jgi:16S rRNA (uracil1498-N3)-methyltransferase
MGRVAPAPRARRMSRGRRLFVPPGGLAAERLTITAADHRYLARVLRVQPGDTVTLFDGAGNEVDARVAEVGRAETELVLGAARVQPRAAGEPLLVLLTAVPRGPRMDLLVEKTCELGVSRVVPVLTERSVARPDDARRGRWEKIAREAARQCGRADVPEVRAPVTLAAALAASDLPSRRLMLWEGEGEGGAPLRARLEGREPVALLVGPEGGFAAAEVEAARHAGFETVTLGSRILRVETAAMVAVALVRDSQLGP